MKTLLDEWNDFANSVLPPDCSRVQRQEMRRAFYAGAKVMLGLMSDLADEFDEDAGAQQVEKLNQELSRFNDDVQGGRA